MNVIDVDAARRRHPSNSSDPASISQQADETNTGSQWTIVEVTKCACSASPTMGPKVPGGKRSFNCERGVPKPLR
jgi:hypothetical protein